jgi:hypothetical protein
MFALLERNPGEKLLKFKFLWELCAFYKFRGLVVFGLVDIDKEFFYFEDEHTVDLDSKFIVFTGCRWWGFFLKK